MATQTPSQPPSLSQAVQTSLQYQQSLEDSIGNRTMDDQHIREITRRYMSSQLRQLNFEEMAERVSDIGITETEDETLDIILLISEQVENEYGQEFEEIFSLLLLSSDDLQPTYDTITTTLFSDNINWGRIVVFLVFSSKLTVYCMQNDMEDKVLDIVAWTERVMQDQLHHWVLERGGWSAFLSHFDREGWKISLSKFAMFASLAVLAAYGGFIMLKKFWK